MKQLIFMVQILFPSVLFYSAAYSQSTAIQSTLLKLKLKLKTQTDSTNKNYGAEKLYLQFDKPYYALGDTIWLKAWLINAPTYLLSAKSGLLHVDIANDSNKVIKQYLLPVQSGLSWGNITLDEKEFKAGGYVIRAYTNWMRNFGEDGFYYKHIQVTAANENNLLVNTQFTTTVTNGNNAVNAKLLFSDIDKKAYAVKALQLQVMNGNKRLYSQKLQTGVDGTLDVNFNIPQKNTNLSIIAESEDKRAVIPIPLNRPENTDLQFLPEGGSLVAGLKTRIGFKAIAEDGKGTAISGTITDQNQKQAAIFQSLHNGIGSFELTPQSGLTYTATVKLPNGSLKTYPLPATKLSGTTLQVNNKTDADSIEINFSATGDQVQLKSDCFLIGKARGVICYAAVINFNKSDQIHRSIAKGLFPSGITHIIITDAKGQPLNERLIFIDHHDNLHISIEPDQQAYEPKDSVALHLKVTDNAGNPVIGNFSLAVTDDSQVKRDTLNDDNIFTHLLLTADLKGNIESPGFYLQNNETAAKSMDNLLLTQGWVSYEPTQPKPLYPAETEYKISGSVVNVFSKPVKGTKVTLFSKSPLIATDTLTDKSGRFAFYHIPRVDTPVFILNAVNKSGKAFNVSINMDEMPPPIFNAPGTPTATPWYVNSDSTLIGFLKDNIEKKKLEYNPEGKHQLKEVKITAKKIVKGSYNLNGTGNADVVIDEKDLEALGKKTFLQLLTEHVKGFRVGAFVIQGNSPKAVRDRGLFSFVTDRKASFLNPDWYFINGKPVKFIVDGVSINLIIAAVDYSDITNYLNFHTAEDLKGIEVCSSSKFAALYAPNGFGIDDVAFIEITTRSGNPAITNTPGIYLYKPLALSYPAQFYKPKYKLTDTAKRATDLRSTIDWESNITTDAKGMATVSFYAVGQPAGYTVIMEGTDFNGNLGFNLKKIRVNKNKDTNK